MPYGMSHFEDPSFTPTGVPGGDPGGGAGSVGPPTDPTAVTPPPTMTAGGPGGDPTAGGGPAPPTGTTPGTDWLSTLSSDLSAFFNSPLGKFTEFGALAGLGLSQADAQKKTNDQLAASLGKLGAPFSAAGAGELGQLTGGPAVGGPLGTSITQQTDTAKQLGEIAKTYSTGALTASQQQQVDDFVKQQRAMVDTQLAASGNTDSSARQAAYQQIDDNAAKLSQELTQGNVGIATQAQQAVQSTYSTLLNQALASSEFGFGAQEAAVITQIRSDTALSASLNALFGEIAKGFGEAMSGGGKGGGGGGTGNAANTVSSLLKNLTGGGDTGTTVPVGTAAADTASAVGDLGGGGVLAPGAATPGGGVLAGGGSDISALTTDPFAAATGDVAAPAAADVAGTAAGGTAGGVAAETAGGAAAGGGTAAGGSAALGAGAGAAVAGGLIAAPIIAGMSTKPYDLNADYWTGLNYALQGKDNPKGNATYQANTPIAIRQAQAAQQTMNLIETTSGKDREQAIQAWEQAFGPYDPTTASVVIGQLNQAAASASQGGGGGKNL